MTSSPSTCQPAAAAELAAHGGFRLFMQHADTPTLCALARTCRAWRDAVVTSVAPHSLDVQLTVDRYTRHSLQPASYSHAASFTMPALPDTRLASLRRWLLASGHARLVRGLSVMLGPKQGDREARRTTYQAAREQGRAHEASQTALAELLQDLADVPEGQQLACFGTDCCAGRAVLDALQDFSSLKHLTLRLPHLGLSQDPSLPSTQDVARLLRRCQPRLESFSLVLTFMLAFPAHVRQQQVALDCAAVGAICGCTGLTSLELSVGLPADAAQALHEQLPQLERLQQLSLCCRPQWQVAGSPSAGSSSSSSSSSAPAFCCTSDDSSSAGAGGVAGLRQLTRLTLDACSPVAGTWGPPDAAAFRQLAQLPRLASVDLCYHDVAAAAADAPRWSQLPLARLEVRSPLGLWHYLRTDDDNSAVLRERLQAISRGLAAAKSVTHLHLVLDPAGELALVLENNGDPSDEHSIDANRKLMMWAALDCLMEEERVPAMSRWCLD